MAQATRDVVGDVLGQLSGLRPGQLRRLMRDLSGRHRRELIERWQGWAQEGQCEPPGDWRIWMIRAGRGFGKTRAGAEWISEWARMLPEARIALVAANDADGRRVMADGSAWRLAGRTVRAREILLELKRHAPLPAVEPPAAPGIPVSAPDWPDAAGTVHLFDLPNMGNPAASAPHIMVAGAGSNDGWRGADCWIVAAPGSEPTPVGVLRPAAALGQLAAPLAAGTDDIFDLSNNLLVELVNPAMTLESVEDSALIGGANRAMVGGELLQFGTADIVAPGVWRLSRLLRGRAGTAVDAPHMAGTAFALLDDPALLTLPEAVAGWAEAGGAVLQWAPRGGTDLSDVAVPGSGRALRPLAPVHGQIRPDGAGGVTVGWIRRSRVDTGWRDHIDLPMGESREAWFIAISPPVSGIGPWERASPTLDIGAAELAELPPGCTLEIRQAGDFALSPPLSLPLT